MTDGLAPFHAATRAWFQENFPEPTPVQAEGWAKIAAGEHSLLIAPTGSGKTLAAFLWCIDQLSARVPGEGEAPPPPGVRVLYVSPLKALVYDIERNLRAPLVGVERTAARRGEAERFRAPRVAIRTGDTPQHERRAQAKDPAEILVTTPESLYLILGSTQRETLRTVEWIIVDEIHALAPTKRGAHLALSLERLTALCGEREPQRIGLSATATPLAEIARYLAGDRAVATVDTSRRPDLDLTISVPVPDMTRPSDAPVRPVSGDPVFEDDPHDDEAPPAELVPPTLPGSGSILGQQPVAHRPRTRTRQPLAGALSGAARSDPRAPERHRVREQPRSLRTARPPAERARRRGPGSCAPRLDRALPAQGDRGSAQGRNAASDRRDELARARHRHGGGRSGADGRVAGRGRARSAAHRTRRPPGRRPEPRAPLPEAPRGPARSHGRRPTACARGRSSRSAFPRTRSTCSHSRSSRWRRWTAGRSRTSKRWSGAPPTSATLSREMLESVLDMLAGRYPSTDFSELRPRILWDRERRSHRRRGRERGKPRDPVRRARSRTAASTRCTTGRTGRASASSTRRWCTRRGRARP